MKNSVLIAGLGQIGMGYDRDLAPAHALTHARAFSQHPDFELAGGIDPDPKRREDFQTIYKRPAFASIEATAAEVKANVVVVATPTDQHPATVEAFLKNFNPNVVVCEKPLAYDPAEGQRILDQCARANAQLFVNYMRRSDVAANIVRQRLVEGQIQTPLRGMVWYSKGLFNSASHFLNLLQHWFGEFNPDLGTVPGRLWSGVDPEPDFSISNGKARFQFLAVPVEHYFHNTMEIIAPNGRLRYEGAGAKVTWEPASGGRLSGQVETVTSGFDRVQWHVVDELAKSLKGHDAQISRAEDAMATLKICSLLSNRSNQTETL